MWKSTCCKSEAQIAGNTTMYYVCSECGKACDAIYLETSRETLGKEN